MSDKAAAAEKPKLCAGCHWLRRGCMADSPDRCGHPELQVFDYVDGETWSPKANDMRRDPHKCGHEARFHQ